MSGARSVLVTGSSGYLGSQAGRSTGPRPRQSGPVIASDIRTARTILLPGVDY